MEEGFIEVMSVVMGRHLTNKSLYLKIKNKVIAILSRI